MSEEHNSAGITRSLWKSIVPEIEAESGLEGNVVADVCIVGAGIAGLTVAYQLVQSGKRVVVLDARRPGTGETERTTAHLASALDDRFTHLESLHGLEGARRAAESHAAAIDYIEAVVRELKLDCDFRRVDGYLCLGPLDNASTLEAEFAAARRAGLTVELVEDPPVDSFHGPALKFARQAQIDPMRYLAGLAASITRLGGRIISGAQVLEVNGGDSGVDVITEGGQTVRAQAAVVATNTPINDRYVIHTKQAPYRSYAMAFELLAGSDAPDALIWDTEEPYHYVRRALGADGAQVLIVGGEDHKTGQDARPDERWARLEAWTRDHFSGLGRVLSSWSGQVFEPSDGLAFIGRNPSDTDNVYIVTGDSGHGMTHGTIAGILLPELMAGRDHPWATLYDPSRKSLRALPTFAKENLNVAAQYLQWIAPADVTDERVIPRGEGAVIRKGLSLIAVYRDHDGACQRVSAACPHLGAVVAWNAAEKTWDCPAHGSRFSTSGEVVTGPSTCGLTSAEEDEEDTNPGISAVPGPASGVARI